MVKPQSGKTYKITNVKSGTVLDLAGTAGKQVCGYEYHGGANQKWLLEWTGQHWSIKNASNGLYLGIDGIIEDGEPVTGTDFLIDWDIWPDAQDNEHFRIFVPGMLKPTNLDLSEHGNPKPGTPVTLWGKWEGKHQTWKFEEV